MVDGSALGILLKVSTFEATPFTKGGFEGNENTPPPKWA
jgi:hypothetical protein